MSVPMNAQASMASLVAADFHEGIALMESGRAPEAIPALTRCVERNPDFGAGHLYLGLAHAVSCNVYPAIDHLQKATELCPEEFATHFTLAKFYFTLRIPIKGYECASQALDSATTNEQRQALSQLLRQERERERNGIARPLFNRRFGLPSGIAAAMAIIGTVAAIVTNLR